MSKDLCVVNDYMCDECGDGLDLMQITGQESGIVIYRNEDSEDGIIVCNWSSAEPGSFPSNFMDFCLVFTTLFLENDENRYYLKKSYKVDDILDEIPGEVVFDEDEQRWWYEGANLIWDTNGDIPMLSGLVVNEDGLMYRNKEEKPIPTSGTVYEFRDATVIAPDGWN